ncbi:MAG: YbaK/EbsC family protein [Pseudomonadota bacterium]
MSKSLKRVRRALEHAEIVYELRETPSARTAQDAALLLGCDLDQIAKSMVFQGTQSTRVFLFLTAGGNQVDLQKAALLAGEPLDRADPGVVRTHTGFAIGGVAPVGHLTDLRAFLDPRLMGFDVIWAAAGTPHHVFSVSAVDLHKISGAQIADFTS